MCMKSFFSVTRYCASICKCRTNSNQQKDTTLSWVIYCNLCLFILLKPLEYIYVCCSRGCQISTSAELLGNRISEKSHWGERRYQIQLHLIHVCATCAKSVCFIPDVERLFFFLCWMDFLFLILIYWSPHNISKHSKACLIIKSMFYFLPVLEIRCYAICSVS